MQEGREPFRVTGLSLRLSIRKIVWQSKNLQ